MNKDNILAFLNFDESKPTTKLLLLVLALFYFLFKILVLLGKSGFRMLRSFVRFLKRLARVKRKVVRFFKKGK